MSYGMKIHLIRRASMPRITFCSTIVLSCFTWLVSVTEAQSPFEFSHEPISYQTAKDENVVTRLQRRIQQGELALEFHPTRGYLDAILKELEIDIESQALVYSKTSLQLHPITPSNPRALYFNDEAYVGWAPGGDKLELIASDTKLGTVFYTIDQKKASRVLIQRDRGECLQCHANRRTHEVPGPLVRSLYTSASGQPVYNFGNFLSDHTSPLKQRWGGYYVTGNHGDMMHMGNLFVSRDTNLDELDYSQGANRLVLAKHVNQANYPTDTSDIVALMVLEHQTQMQNLITKAIYEERRADHYDATFRIGDDTGSDFTRRRISRVVEELLAYMFFVDEFQLTSQVTGTSEFSRDFARRHPQTASGESLFLLDLHTRLFKYPLSYMIYSNTFQALGPKTTVKLHSRIKEILGDQQSEADAQRYKHLTNELKDVIRKVLIETHPTLGPLFN